VLHQFSHEQTAYKLMVGGDSMGPGLQPVGA